MMRVFLMVAVLVVPLWAPWMDSTSSGVMAERVLEAFGPQPSVCYDPDGTQVSNGLEVRWYPLGRMVHTCSGDYVVWFWGAVKEAGGVYKRADEIQPTHSRPLTCKDIIDRKEVRGSSATSTITAYTGTVATSVDYALFPEATEYAIVLSRALSMGPNFAGKFSVAEWQCGSGCRNFALIDVETGRVLSVGPQTEYGVSYTLDSTVLVTNPLSLMPPAPENSYDTETMALDIARLSREYFRLTTDALSGTQYLVRECVESSASGYIEIEDHRFGVITTGGE